MPDQIPKNEVQFRAFVYQAFGDLKAAVARLETRMDGLVGNGQRGRVATLEEKVEEHDLVLEGRKSAGKVWLTVVGVGGSIIGGLVQWLLAAHPR